MKPRRERLSILGSTGSIGRSALAVAAALDGRFRVIGLAAGSNVPLLVRQAERFRPRLVSLKTESDAAAFKKRFRRSGVEVLFGPEGAAEVARQAENDLVVSAITGFDGLGPTMAAVRAGTRIALANKESLVVAGGFLKRAAARSGARILPVDSEHCGVFQCLAGVDRGDVRKVILTASGGPFFRTPRREMDTRTVEQALRHPRWKMGKKVTVDSATMMNKGFELIEARWLFDLEPGKLDVLVHPQSIVHALVEMRDGSVIAQLSRTDMRIPIQFALTFPERVASPLPPLDLGRTGRLEFFPVDAARFPLYGLARTALEEGESFPVALNAANEVAVGAFLGRSIPFGGIARLVRKAMDGHAKRPVRTIDDVYVVDAETRRRAGAILKQRT
jgi:1-deoxy-D-xylulose-5-phosphate reductoisomerase